MSKSTVLGVSCALLFALACGAPPADQGGKQAAKAKPAEPAKPVEPAKAAAPEPAPAPEPEPTPAPEPEPAVEAPAEGEAADTDAATADEGEAAEPPAGDASAGWKPPEGADIRSDAVIPPGTPAANAEAFKRLPQTKVDGPPVSGIAGNGLHFDVMVVGRGWEKSKCVEATDRFSVATDDRVNICVRVVHPSDAEESLTVAWSKNGGKATRRSTISVKAMHAYLTRGYLPIKPGYEGEWTATITAPDGTVLATLPFTVE